MELEDSLDIQLPNFRGEKISIQIGWGIVRLRIQFAVGTDDFVSVDFWIILLNESLSFGSIGVLILWYIILSHYVLCLVECFIVKHKWNISKIIFSFQSPEAVQHLLFRQWDHVLLFFFQIHHGSKH